MVVKCLHTMTCARTQLSSTAVASDIHARVTIIPKGIQLARRIRGERGGCTVEYGKLSDETELTSTGGECAACAVSQEAAVAIRHLYVYTDLFIQSLSWLCV